MIARKSLSARGVPPMARVFPPLMVGAGFAMAMTAPLELLYARRFGAGPAALAVYIATPGIGVLLVDVLGSRFVPRLDARATLAAGMWCFAIASVALGVSPTFLPLLPARAIQGFGGGLMLGSALQAALRINPVRHEALISFNSAFLLGGAVGAPAGGFLAGLAPGTDGFRLTFGICAALSVVVALSVRMMLPPLPPATGSGQPSIGLPRLTGLPGLGPALALGTLGDFLRGGVVYTALSLAGQARHLSTATIGIAVGLLLAVEIVTVRNAGPFLVRFGIVRCLTAALAAGVVLSTVLAVAEGRPAFVASAFLFGIVIAAATIAPPLVLVSLNSDDTAAGLASYRVSSGIGMLVGSTGAGAAAAALGPTAVFVGIAAVLSGGVVLSHHIGKGPAPA